MTAPPRPKITDLMTKIDRRIIKSETELARNFLNVIEEELHARDLTPIIEQQRKIVRGRSDARIGGLVFEFKRPGVKDLSDKKSIEINPIS